MGADAAGTGLAVGLLGPVEIGPAAGVMTEVAQPRLRVLLGLLGAAAGRVVSAEALVDGVWGEEWSPRREQNLHALVYQLRRRLAAAEPGAGPGRGRARLARAGPGYRLARAGPGYRLALGPGELDVAVFQDLAARGRAAVGAGDTAGARELLGQALGVWRGAALADAAPLCARLAGEAARLEEQRLAVVEERAGCDLALGRHAEVAGELAALAGEFPLRERLAGLLMTALYRCGRRGEALAVYDSARRVLAEQLGLDPGPELAGLQAKVLADDPALAAPAPAAPAVMVAAATRTLPRDIASSTGRQGELARLLAKLETLATGGGVVEIHAIDGMAGIGKTTFAVHAAHQLAERFPDGQFFVPLHAHTAGQRPVDAADALASVLLTAGVPAQFIPPGLEARVGRWRDHVAGKKILLLLDDAAGHEQVRPLLPGTAGSLVLVTSRRRLVALEDAGVISLDVLPAGEAVELLARLAGRPDLAAPQGPAGEIARLCGYLPLAIAMLAGQLRHHPGWTGAELAAALAAARDPLDMMSAENVSVAAAFDLSYADLTAGQQRVFRRLGLFPGSAIDAYAVAALDAASLGQTRRRLGELYDHHLIDEPAPGRYRLHDLLREYARALAAADDPPDRDAATGRLLDYYLHTALAAGQQVPARTAAQGRPPPGSPPACAPPLSTPQRAAAWLETERPNLDAAAGYAMISGRTLHAVQIPAAVGDFLRAHGDWEQAAVLHQTALAAARQASDLPGQALALRQLGILGWLTGKFAEAASSLNSALELYAELGDVPGQAYALNHVGKIQQLTGDYLAAAESRHQALALARSAGDQLGTAVALSHLGEVQQLTGDYQASMASLQQSRKLFRSAGQRVGEADVLLLQGRVQRETGDSPAALASHQQALALYRQTGDRAFQALALNELGLTQLSSGDYAAAGTSLRQALDANQAFGNRLGEAETLNSLAELSSQTFDTSGAREHHTRALTIARDVGSPLEEARALEGLGRSDLADGNENPGLAYLRQALEIYQRIRAGRTERVQQALRHDGSRLPEQTPAASGEGRGLDRRPLS